MAVEQSEVEATVEMKAGEEEEEQCPVKQVELTVPKTDDPNMPVLTFRMWVLGLASCVILAIVNQFFWYRTQPMVITSISAQIAVVPLGHLMAKTLPKRMMFQGTKWEFSLNPGPFNVKEHVLITIFANAGAGTVYATHVLSAVKLFYKRQLTFFLPCFLWLPLRISFHHVNICLLGLLVCSQICSGSATGFRHARPWNWCFRFDWSTVASYLGSPLASPWFATANVALGFCAIIEVWKQSKRAFGGKSKMDIHTRLMQKYKSVPSWWFLIILIVNIAVVIITCEYYNETLQLRWWGVLLACAIALFFTLPIGIIYATTNQAPGLNIITEYIIGYIYPERPVANMCFKVYGYISMIQALTFIQDFKLGHYMKIPPRSMFMAQVVGSLVSVFVYLLTAWGMMGAIPNLCDRSKLPKDSPWKCPMDTVFFDASVIWGLVGPRRIFGNLGEYGMINWSFVGGAIALSSSGLPTRLSQARNGFVLSTCLCCLVPHQ
ncbi:hypothetical protein GH714_031630 [Hevea brasiliensis]|uniref:Uncharacterized protein n=1 Tax=Hevea brasiliensis TaxID=3981 RepID=A0A6A6LGB8_HEVBR|nr:hypothetical protein GH714_031630 [Hevea brasiliensis]